MEVRVKLETKVVVDLCGMLQQYGVGISLTKESLSFDVDVVDIGEALERVPLKDRPEAERVIMGMLWSFDIRADNTLSLEEELKVRSR